MQPSRSGSESDASRELVVERVFEAPARLLFEAHARPEHIKRWFGPRGYPVTLCEMDFRVGGRWRFAMTGPNGVQQTAFGGQYLEIVPNEKIVYDNAFELPGAEKMVTTVTFVERGGKTTLTIRTVFASQAMWATHVGAGMAEGIQSGLDQLAEVVASLR